jgi:hypothetical protein
MANANITSTQDSVESWKNPHFERVNRAPYELGHLLQRLPENFSSFSPARLEVIQIADAAAQHADNANGTLMRGLEALGEILFVAGANKENDIDQESIASIGELIQHIAVEAQFLQETMVCMRAGAFDLSSRTGVEKGGE